MLRGKSNWYIVAISALMILCRSPFYSSAQSSAMIEVYGPVQATQVAHSLGTNIAPFNEWEYKAAQAARITWGRFDCPWQNVELQKLPQNVSEGYSLPGKCASGITFGKNYGVTPIVDALYGAPYGSIATATTTADLSPGAINVPLHVNNGALSYVHPGQSYLKVGTGDISSRHAYAGTLITRISDTSVNLASALTTALPAGTTVTINLQLYPPVLLTPGIISANQRSVQAYGRYVHYLQTQVAANGGEGRVSIWNEPPWSGDPWDTAGNLYDHPPLEQRIKQDFGVELAYYSASLPPIAGAMLDNGYTNKTGNGSLFVPERRSLLPPHDAVHNLFISESFHPYGNNPEDAAWLPSCIKTHRTSNLYGKVFDDCTPVGMVVGSNTKWQAVVNASVGSFRGLDLAISETGLQRGENPAATEAQITRFDLRQFLVFSGSGVHPILFYRLAGDPHYEWLHTDHSPYPVYTAFVGLMKDISLIARAPESPIPDCALPAVTTYTGSYPLALTILMGSKEDDTNASLLLYTWQRTYSSHNWVALPSPPSAKVSLTIPLHLRLSMIKDLVTNAPVDYTFTGGKVSYLVTDDPTEMLLSPSSSNSVPLTFSCHDQ